MMPVGLDRRRSWWASRWPGGPAAVESRSWERGRWHGPKTARVRSRRYVGRALPLAEVRGLVSATKRAGHMLTPAGRETVNPDQ